MHYSAKRGIEIACHCRPFALRRPKAIHLLPGNIGKFWETRGGVGKSGVLEHKSNNTSETRKDRGKVIMDGQ